MGTGRCGGGRYGGGHYGGGHYSGGRYGGALQRRVDATAESHDTHITMDSTAERLGGKDVIATITMLSIFLITVPTADNL